MNRPRGAARNRTGIAAVPEDAEATIDGARAGVPSPHFETRALTAARLACGRVATPVGSMPLPVTVEGAGRSALDALQRRQPLVFLDLVGARMAFERTGTRLYEALMAKLEVARSPVWPAHDDLERIRDEELAHVGLLMRATESLGADPTAMTPGADVAGVAGRGLIDAITDPRTTPLEAVEAILVAELVDNDGWLVLADLSARLGHEEMAADFRHAMAEEEEHLARVRAWLTAAVDREAGFAAEAPGIIEHLPHPH